MKRMHNYLEKIESLRVDQVILDQLKFVLLYEDNSILSNSGAITDKVGFEAFNNHYHLYNHIDLFDVLYLKKNASFIAKYFLYKLTSKFPQTRFVVILSYSLWGSVTIRFHQKWDGENNYLESQKTLFSAIVIEENQ